MGGRRWPGHSSGNKRSSLGSRLSERGRRHCAAPLESGRAQSRPMLAAFQRRLWSFAQPSAQWRTKLITSSSAFLKEPKAPQVREPREPLIPGPTGRPGSIRTTQAQGTAAGSLLGNRVIPRRLRPGLPPPPGPAPGHRAHGPESTVGEHGGDAGGQDPGGPRTGRSILPTLAPEQYPVALPGPSGDVRTGVPWALPNHPLCPPRQVPGEHEDPQRGHDPGLPLQGWSQA